MKKIILVLGFILTIANAETFSTTDYIKVERSKPYYKTVIKREPYQECWDERVPVRQRGGGSNRYNNPPIGALIGGIAGGILGHQIGGGSGKTAATVGGAIIGTMVGNNLSNDDDYYEYTTYETKRRCTTHYNESRERKLVGYKNIGYYKGRKIVKISKRRLDYIPITVKIIY